jgi:hypothetical protein
MIESAIGFIIATTKFMLLPEIIRLDKLRKCAEFKIRK